MTVEGRSAVQRLLVLVGGVYLCSLAISLLFTEPADYQRNCCDPAGRGVSETLRQLEAIPQQPALEEVSRDDLGLGINRVLPGGGHVRRRVERREGVGVVWGRRNRRGVGAAIVDSNTVIVQNHTKSMVTPQNISKMAPDVPTVPTTRLPEYHLILHQEYLCHQVDDDANSSSQPAGGSTRPMPVYLLIIVHSHPGHKRRRNAIRETWGRVVHDYDRAHQVAVVFALGLPRDYDEYKGVQKEARLYRDVIVWDFTDDYRNLTLKSLAGFGWAAEHCPSATYVMKADDDVYLNVPYLCDVILPSYPTQNLILGSLNSDSPVRRYGQWKVAHSQYPQSHFPPYCSGCAYVISADMASRLHQLSQSDQSPPIIPVEDVYVTGLLAGRLGVTCNHHPEFPTWITVPSVGLVQRYLRSELVGLHGVDWIRMHSMWHMIQQCTDCATNVQQAKHWLSWVMEKDPMYR